MALPQYDRVLFANAQLRLAVAQVRFPILLRFADGAFVAPFQQAIEGEYPELQREQSVSFQVSEKGIQPGPGETLLRFISGNRQWAAVLGESALTLEVKGYSAIDDFADRFQRLIVAGQEHLGVRTRARLGLRYINEFRHPEARTIADWAQLFRPEFIGFPGTDLLEGKVEHAVEEIQFTRGDGVLAIRHGLLAGAAVEPAAGAPPPSGKFYLLDLDYYDARSQTMNIDGTIQQLRSYNDVMYRFFRWTLGDRLFQYLRPNNAH